MLSYYQLPLPASLYLSTFLFSWCLTVELYLVTWFILFSERRCDWRIYLTGNSSANHSTVFFKFMEFLVSLP